MILILFITAGQERFRSITKSYYRNSVGVLLVYDITNHASFEHIPLWMMEAKRHIEPHRPVFALTGCKLDLVSNGARREVSRDEAKSFAEQNGLFFVETSARTGVNVEEVFNMVTQEVSSQPMKTLHAKSLKSLLIGLMFSFPSIGLQPNKNW